RAVREFKTGPDFLDPMILERASGHPTYQLDLWMGGEEHCRALLYEAAREADLILIEGVMGLFDGTPSSADLAQLFGVPVLAVIDAESMAQSFGAIAHGLASYRAGLSVYGVLANRVAGARHAELTREGTPPELAYLGAVMRDSGLELPDRHLGLVQAEEVGDLEKRLSAAAEALRATKLVELPPAVEFVPASARHVARGACGGPSAHAAGPGPDLRGAAAGQGPDLRGAAVGQGPDLRGVAVGPGPDLRGAAAGQGPDLRGVAAEQERAGRQVPPEQGDVQRSLLGIRIGIARDRAFSFLYPANLDLLRAMGAELVFFSPLADPGLPQVDSVYLPGGYPELHLAALSANRSLAKALQAHVEAGKPLYAECGGMLYLFESLTDVEGRCANLT